MIRIAILSASALFAFALAPATATAQEYPSRPIRIVVGYSPGAGIDFTARLFADWMKKAFGQSVIVENRPGASGNIAAEYVSHAEPDGYTLIYAVGSDLEWTKFLTKQRAVDPLTELTPIATVISAVNCVAVNASRPFATFKELVEYTKQNPGKLTYGTAGTQSYYYLMGQALKQQGVDMLPVPYTGNAPVATALLAGETDAALTALGAVSPYVKSGNVRVLAVMEPKRFSRVPNIPAISEILPDFHAPRAWFGLFGPPGLPQPIVQKLSAEIGAALRSPEIDEKIQNLDFNIFPTDANDVRPLIVDSTETFRRLIETMNIQPAD